MRGFVQTGGLPAILLASASPRRRELMELAGFSFEAAAVDTPETFDGARSVEENALQIAAEKARAAAGLYPGRLVVAADTMVNVDGEVFGKPRDAEDAAAMLARLSGRAHEVVTGVCVVYNGMERGFVARAKVTFFRLTEEQIRAYIATGEPADKAGAYAIQGRGCLFVERIDGDYYAVVGLPVARLAREIEALAKNYTGE